MYRFTSLDAFRGVAVLGIAVYHWALMSVGADLGKLGNLYLLIDFFFVLSGFILATIYREQVKDGASAVRFLLMRLARLYPVHIFVLAAFLALATISGGLGDAPFSADGFAAHLFLIQPFGQDAASWNQPAWTISVELQLCILFALLCVAGIVNSPMGRICLGAAVIATLFYLTTQHGDLNITTANALGRGFVSFATGILLHSAAKSDWTYAALTALKRRTGTEVEVLAIAFTVTFVALAVGPASFAAPFVFAALIFVFLQDQGEISHILRHRRLAHLSTLSYAIFMAHYLSIPPMQVLIESAGGSALVIALSLPIYLGLTIGLAYFVHRLVETPTRDAMRLWIERRVAVNATTAKVLIRSE